MSSTGASGSNSAGDGITGGYTGDSLVLRIIIATFTALAWYNALELNILIFVTFRKYSGLYFWSLLVSSWGVIPYAMGFLFKFFQIVANDIVSVTLITIGWYCMVTGQSVVLYSRLHLVLRNPVVLKRILWMICVDAVILHIPTTILTYGSNGDLNTQAFVHGYNVMEKIQMTGFCIQEFIISGFYLYETLKILKTVNHAQTRRTMYQLVWINIIIILMDLGLLAVEYANFYIVETSVKGVIYSVKLKLEFAILGKLVQYVTESASVEKNDITIPDFVDSKTGTDGLHAPYKLRKSSRPSVSPPDNFYDLDFEHVERPSQDIYANMHREIHKPAKGRQDERTRSEEDIELMMRKYSIKTPENGIS